jgi:hypothetical protein
MKSNVMPVASMALAMANSSCGRPTQSLIPTGLPPDNSRNFAANSTSSRGVEKALWRGGDAILAHRHAAGGGDFGRDLGGGQHAAMAGLGAL